MVEGAAYKSDVTPAEPWALFLPTTCPLAPFTHFPKLLPFTLVWRQLFGHTFLPPDLYLCSYTPPFTMARFSLSFLSIFLVLAVLTLSMPTKRDEPAAGQPFGLAGPVGDLVVSQLFQIPHDLYHINQ